MSYEPTVWKNGDVITPEKLNKIEQGVAGGGGALIIEWDGEGDLDASYQDIMDAVNAGKRVEMKVDASVSGGSGFKLYYLVVVKAINSNGPYDVSFRGDDSSYVFSAASATAPLSPMADDK